MSCRSLTQRRVAGHPGPAGAVQPPSGALSRLIGPTCRTFGNPASGPAPAAAPCRDRPARAIERAGTARYGCPPAVASRRCGPGHAPQGVSPWLRSATVQRAGLSLTMSGGGLITSSRCCRIQRCSGVAGGAGCRASPDLRITRSPWPAACGAGAPIGIWPDTTESPGRDLRPCPAGNRTRRSGSTTRSIRAPQARTRVQLDHPRAVLSSPGSAEAAGALQITSALISWPHRRSTRLVCPERSDHLAACRLLEVTRGLLQQPATAADPCIAPSSSSPREHHQPTECLWASSRHAGCPSSAVSDRWENRSAEHRSKSG